MLKKISSKNRRTRVPPIRICLEKSYKKPLVFLTVFIENKIFLKK